MDNDTIKDLGLCPICQKGHIMKGSLDIPVITSKT